MSQIVPASSGGFIVPTGYPDIFAYDCDYQSKHNAGEHATLPPPPVHPPRRPAAIHHTPAKTLAALGSDALAVTIVVAGGTVACFSLRKLYKRRKKLESLKQRERTLAAVPRIMPPPSVPSVSVVPEPPPLRLLEQRRVAIPEFGLSATPPSVFPPPLPIPNASRSSQPLAPQPPEAAAPEKPWSERPSDVASGGDTSTIHGLSKIKTPRSSIEPEVPTTPPTHCDESRYAFTHEFTTPPVSEDDSPPLGSRTVSLDPPLLDLNKGPKVGIIGRTWWRPRGVR